MLKDKFSKFFNKSKNSEPLKLNIMDGFVDIKGYKVKANGSKELIYHDCGDNVVTDWMRHAIMVMLTGCVFSQNGKDFIPSTTPEGSRSSNNCFSMPGSTSEYHSKQNKRNLDGYLLNGEQYFFDADKITKKYSMASDETSFANNKYAMFPTKILFGTGKEYSSWDILQSENEAANATWYTEMVNSYGGNLASAKSNFDNNIDSTCNSFSGSISKNIYTGNGKITKMRTVNDPDTSSSIISTTSTMNKNYGVVGAVKTMYFDDTNDRVYLQSTMSDQGKLLKPIYRGVGRPCFIYFNTPRTDNNSIYEGWDSPSAEVYLSKDSTSNYLNKITFSITMPSQSASSGAIGAYYPYNGYTLKQMGLYNDALLTTSSTGSSDTNTYPYLNMQHGMLLALKNITAFQKSADVEMKISWTLTI